MKGTKCFGLLSLLAIMLGLSLSVSSDVSAKKYIIDSFWVHGTPYSTPASIFMVGDHSDLDPYNASFLWTKYNSSTGKCYYDNSYKNPGYTFGSNSSETGLQYDGFFIPKYSDEWFADYFSTLNDQVCHTQYGYGASNDVFSIPEYDNSSTPLTSSINVSSILPYNYIFNSLSFYNERSIDGIQYSGNFDVSMLLNRLHANDSEFTYYTDIIKYFEFPLNFNYELEDLQSGSILEFSGKLFFGSGLSSSEVSNLKIDFYVYNNGSNILVPCVLSFSSYDNSLSYYCRSSSLSYSIPASEYGIVFRVYTSDQSPISSVAQSLTFDFIYITLNNDDTDGGLGSFSANGSYPNVAPGVPDTDPDYNDLFSSLFNMFGFNVVNPVSPIFAMFTSNTSDNSGCAYIPTIASMLHSSESTVCPWFSADTRNIGTSVLGFSAMMLLFGFFVSWLGAASGNNFEDSSTHVSGNFKIGGKR